jgi:acetyl-CoA carboxylase biotin carboxyl carrier protein
MSINFQELRELIAAIASTDITELNLKNTEFELTVRKAPAVVTQVTSAAPITLTAAAPSSAAEATAPPAPSPLEKKWVEVKSPMVGTFYRAPGPDEPSFVSVGDRIAVKQAVCIIEAMKLMNELEAEVAGQVMEIVVENGQPVEFGQTLMYVNPS